MKLVFFFVCALAAFQSFEARSVEVAPIDVPSLGDIISGKDVLNDNGLQEAIARLKLLIVDITDQIDQIITRIGQGDINLEAITSLIQSIADITAQIIDTIDERIQQFVEEIGKVIANIRKTIQKIIEQGTKAAACVEKQSKQIETLIDFANQGLQKCVSDAKAVTVSLQDQIKARLRHVQELQNDIVTLTLGCVNEHQGDVNDVNDLADLVKCLRDQNIDITEKVGTILVEVRYITLAAQEVTARSARAVDALRKCSEKLQNDIVERQRKIIDNIRQCIAESQP